jgi:3-oxoacyl-[acyl-carrier protein] reductase
MLEDKVAIVTGSGRGIGRATAEQLSALGARVVVNDLDGDVARTVADGLPGESAAWVGDLTQPDAPEELVGAAIAAFGRLDIVVNNAGYVADAPIHKTSDDAFRAMLDIHTMVPFRVLRAAAPHLREPAKAELRAGREVFRKVVNVTSLAGTMGNAGQANYSSAKAGVVGLTKTLAKEWGALKINVNAVAFGLVDSRLTTPPAGDATIAVGGRSAPIGLSAEVRRAMEALVPLGRGASAQEAAGGIVFLCSPWSDYVTGQVLTVSGGLALGMES